MLRECRCGNCKRLLARIGEFTELQIKCSRCGTLNHVKAKSPEQSPLSEESVAKAAQFNYSTQ
ncbi:Com family DNA-binding transcriptional regulator [Pseudomonas chlororaphis]|uniref:Com family DNA-binding transcriptional regulator n=1 Tax=Pseudomonas chlororaphis TaxID=587753 RepID=UPI0023678FA3|nr:Com family DNA-binding transcriptional regulator [Pseudomonas chlororaphis]WDH38224.1 Com family DNA-binding transcriptional regulator [Pseudomonas chlororaphis]WDH44312.1 Com family DNA-binding transcriptional regulator [Pseudomonas chlororaphis]